MQHILRYLINTVMPKWVSYDRQTSKYTNMDNINTGTPIIANTMKSVHIQQAKGDKFYAK